MIQSSNLRPDEVKNFGEWNGRQVVMGLPSGDFGLCKEFVRFCQGDHISFAIHSLVDCADAQELNEVQSAKVREQERDPSDYCYFGGISMPRELAALLTAERNALRVRDWTPNALVIATEPVECQGDSIGNVYDDRLIPDEFQAALLTPYVLSRMPGEIVCGIGNFREYEMTRSGSPYCRYVGGGIWRMSYAFTDPRLPLKEDMFGGSPELLIVLRCSIVDTMECNTHYRYRVRWDMDANPIGEKQSNEGPYGPYLHCAENKVPA